MTVKIEAGAWEQGQPVYVGGELDHWEGGTAFLVKVGSSNEQKAAVAIQEAVSRMYVVEDVDGAELTRARYEDVSLDWATPNYISLSTQGDRFALYLDYKGELGVMTCKTLIGILVEELESASVDAVVDGYVPPDDGSSWDELEVWVRYSR